MLLQVGTHPFFRFGQFLWGFKPSKGADQRELSPESHPIACVLISGGGRRAAGVFGGAQGGVSGGDPTIFWQGPDQRIKPPEKMDPRFESWVPFTRVQAILGLPHF